MRCLFVTPPLAGPTTGGTLYNRRLLAELKEVVAGSPPLTADAQRPAADSHQAPTPLRSPAPLEAPAQLQRSAPSRPSSDSRAPPASLKPPAQLQRSAPLRPSSDSRALLASLKPPAQLQRSARLPPCAGSSQPSAQLQARAVQSLQPFVDRVAMTVEQCSLQALPEHARPEQVWVDSLYLAELPALRRRFAQARVGLLLHYLPSLLTNPQLRAASELSEVELRALTQADMIVTPSEFLRQRVLALCPGKPCACVSPGVDVTTLGGATQRDQGALMICNITENKGVLPLLTELAELVSPSASFRLSIAGSLQLDPAYAQRCQALCEQHAWLREHVHLLGSLPQPELFERLGRASALISASRFESYGMALAEARALGTPIVALAGGNAANLVAAESGGQIEATLHGLAAATCQLLTDPDELSARLARARACAIARPWKAAALEFSEAIRGAAIC